MPVPDFQTLTLPSLEVFSDGVEHANREVRDRVAKSLHLTDSDLDELLPSGTQTAFDNRVHWALWYMQKCALLERMRRGVHRITERGRHVLDQKPKQIDVRFLSQYPEFKALQRRAAPTTDAQPIPLVQPNLETPDALLARAWADHREALEDDLLQRLLAVSPRRFEAIVVELLVAMGYGGSFADAAQRIGRSGDGGIDGIIKEDRLGLDTVYVQAKRWQGNVSRPEIQKFAGSLQGVRAKKGIFITTSEFTREAEEFAKMIDTRIVLIDGRTLARFLFEFDQGVRKHADYAVKKIDEEFFDDE